MTFRRLTRAEVEATVREVERQERFKFGSLPVVKFTLEKRDPSDYASFEAKPGKRGGIRSERIRLFAGVPPDLQRVELRHELRESIGRARGKSMTRSHGAAMHREKKDLEKLPYRTSKGTPYKETLPLIRKYERGARPSKPQSWWGSFRRGLGL